MHRGDKLSGEPQRNDVADKVVYSEPNKHVCTVKPVQDSHLWVSYNWSLLRGGCITEVDCSALVLFGPREAGYFREVAA